MLYMCMPLWPRRAGNAISRLKLSFKTHILHSAFGRVGPAALELGGGVGDGNHYQKWVSSLYLIIKLAQLALENK